MYDRIRLQNLKMHSLILPFNLFQIQKSVSARMEYNTALEQDHMEGVDADEWNEWNESTTHQLASFHLHNTHRKEFDWFAHMYT